MRAPTTDAGPPRTVEAVQFRGPPADPPGVERESGGRIGRAYVRDAAGERLYLEAGDWIVPDPDHLGRFYVSADATFRRVWEPVEPEPITAYRGIVVGYERAPDDYVWPQAEAVPCAAPPFTPLSVTPFGEVSEPPATPTKHANTPDDAPDAQGDHQ